MEIIDFTGVVNVIGVKKNNCQNIYSDGNILNNIDQSQLLTSSYLGFASTNPYRIAQSFLNTKKYFAGLTIKKGPTVGSPTTDIKIYLQSDNGGIPGTTIYQKTINYQVWNGIPDNSDYFFDIPAVLNTGSTYWIVFDASQNASNYRTIYINTGGYINGTMYTYNGSTYVSTTNDIYFKTHYFINQDGYNNYLSGVSGNVVNSYCDYDIVINRDEFFEVFFWMIALVVIYLFVYKIIIWSRELFR